MSYNLEFHVEALKEWKKLNPSIKAQFKKQLEKRLEKFACAIFHLALTQSYRQSFNF
ncbi:type II toxin-antitoxin system RelE family toxin [Ampullimonas aquatilis]|uniref:type II toxin-antitoxin system RelE family toxin n=1 Tax=Ampullimonas aquatilis TaxID=1341549 RepID=UPI003C761CA7